MDVTTTAGLTAASALLGVEVVERKGAGHPDTLADGTAEAISRAYSRYCLEEFGAILHHNTDKTSLLGGAADVRFGHSELTAPVQVLVNGRITAALGDHAIPVADIVTTAARDYLAGALPLLDVARWVDVQPQLTQASSPGAVSDPGAAAREASASGGSPRAPWTTSPNGTACSATTPAPASPTGRWASPSSSPSTSRSS